MTTLEITEQLLLKATHLPTTPGCYLMKNQEGVVLYVGKAKSLKGRVVSYFNKSAKSLKTGHLVSHVRDFDFILTSSEVEAFVLENRLIKQHTPKYNIRLRDDKTYPYLQIDRRADFSRLSFTRKPHRGSDDFFVFGPFAGDVNLRDILRILTKSLGFRDCSLNEFKRRKTNKTPCLLYQMHHCTAPCVDYISVEDYKVRLKYVIDFFQGHTSFLLSLLKARLIEASESEEYEKATLLRDSFQLLQQFLNYREQKQYVEYDEITGRFDIVVCYQGKDETDIVICMIREGIWLGHKQFTTPLFFSDGNDDSDEGDSPLLTYLLQYYSQNITELPDVIAVDIPPTDQLLLEESLRLLASSENESNSVRVVGELPQFKKLTQMAQDQAAEQQRVRSHDLHWKMALKSLQFLLGLAEIPTRLECYDVAIWQGDSPTAAGVVWDNGKLQKELYRHYHLTPLAEGNNDFAMMSEVLSRRVGKEESKDKHKENLPDLIVIDGGKGQLNCAITIFKELGISCPVVALAKEKSKTGKEERLFLPGRKNPILLSQNPPLLRLLCLMRNEAHRFSRKLHHLQEKKRVIPNLLKKKSFSEEG